jgi:hypothetical protein
MKSGERAGRLAIVRISVTPDANVLDNSPSAIEHLLEQLRGSDAYPMSDSQTLTAASDFLVFYDGDYYFVKPLVRRLWLASSAAHDAFRLVHHVRQLPTT